MINAIYRNDVYRPDCCFNRNYRKFNIDVIGNQFIDISGTIWPEDISYVSRSSTFMHSAMTPTTWIIKNRNLSEKLGVIKGLVVSDRYKIDAEKLAEKMMGDMVCLLMAS